MPSKTNDEPIGSAKIRALYSPPAFYKRTRPLQFVICGLSFIIFGALILSAAISDKSRSEWPRFRGSQNLTGVTSVELPKPLRLRWTFPAKDSIESSAAIFANTVYVGSMDGSLYAIDLATGKLRWRYAASGPIQESSPCVQNRTVYIGDLNGILHAVDAVTGKSRWTFKAGSEIKSSPNCAGDRIYFGSYDQYLYCLSAENGSLIWKYATEGPVHSTPAVDNGRVYVSGCDETFHAIDGTTGKQIFTVKLGAYTGASAAVLGQRAYVGTFGNEVLSINLKARIIEWVYKHPSRSFPFFSSAAVTTDRVVLGGRDKHVHCLERSSGKLIWTFPTGARVESSPLVNGNRVFIGSNDGLLYELDLETGKKNWDFTAGSPLSASPAAVSGFLVIGSHDGTLYCFGR